MPLNGSNTILGMDTVAPGRWEQLIDLTLNPNAAAAAGPPPPPPDTDSLLDWGAPRPAPVHPGSTADDGRRAYVPVAAKQLVGVYLTVWARRYVRRWFDSLFGSSACEPCGLGMEGVS